MAVGLNPVAIPNANAFQQPNRGRDALAPGKNAGFGRRLRSEGILPSVS